MSEKTMRKTLEFRALPLVRVECGVRTDESTTWSQATLSSLYDQISEFVPASQDLVDDDEGGATYWNDMTGVSVEVRPEFVAVNWTKGEGSVEPYPRFDRMVEIVLKSVPSLQAPASSVFLSYVVNANNGYGPIKDLLMPHVVPPMLKDDKWFDDLSFTYEAAGSETTIRLSVSATNEGFLIDTAAGRYTTAETEDIVEQLTLAHDVLIGEFMSLISEEARKVWGYVTS